MTSSYAGHEAFPCGMNLGGQQELPSELCAPFLFQWNPAKIWRTYNIIARNSVLRDACYLSIWSKTQNSPGPPDEATAGLSEQAVSHVCGPGCRRGAYAPNKCSVGMPDFGNRGNAVLPATA